MRCAGVSTRPCALLEQALEQTATGGSKVYPLLFTAERVASATPVAWRRRSALAERALDLAREHQERGHQAYALRLLGEIAARREPPGVEQAEAYYHQALALAEELGMRPLQAHCHRGLGTLYAATGQREQARTELSTAIEMYHVDGHDVLAAPDGSGAGAGGGAVMDYDAVLAPGARSPPAGATALLSGPQTPVAAG